MEAELVLIVSGVGTLLSLVLLSDAWADRELVHREYDDHEGLKTLTRHRVISESFRLLVQFTFLVTSIAVVFGSDTHRMAALWLLVAIPILLMVWSAYSWIYRRRQID